MANLGITLLCFIFLACALVAAFFALMPNKKLVEKNYKCDGESQCTGNADCPVHSTKKDCDNAKDCGWDSNISKMETFKKQKQVYNEERFSNRCKI